MTAGYTGALGAVFAAATHRVTVLTSAVSQLVLHQNIRSPAFGLPHCRSAIEEATADLEPSLVQLPDACLLQVLQFCADDDQLSVFIGFQGP